MCAQNACHIDNGLRQVYRFGVSGSISRRGPLVAIEFSVHRGQLSWQSPYRYHRGDETGQKTVLQCSYLVKILSRKQVVLDCKRRLYAKGPLAPRAWHVPHIPTQAIFFFVPNDHFAERTISYAQPKRRHHFCMAMLNEPNAFPLFGISIRHNHARRHRIHRLECAIIIVVFELVSQFVGLFFGILPSSVCCDGCSFHPSTLYLTEGSSIAQ